MLPNVVYAGMGKAGSTLLHKLFLRHPNIYVSESHKEINFFSSDDRWSLGVNWYERIFAGHHDEKWVVDISPGYHNKLESILRIKEVLGHDVKIIFTFRRFTDFAYSRYLHRIRGKIMKGSFIELLDNKSMFYRPLDLLVGKCIDLFGRENVLMMHYEKHFDRALPRFEQAIYDFLGLPVTHHYYEISNDISVNSGFVPRFIYANGMPYTEERDGVEYVVPAGTLVYCSGRPYKNVYWTRKSLEKYQEFTEIQKTWTTCLDEETYWYVQKKYTEPLARRLEDKLNIPFGHWYIEKPKRLEYRQAPLPDAYISDPAERAARMAINKTQTPWS